MRDFYNLDVLVVEAGFNFLVISVDFVERGA